MKSNLKSKRLTSYLLMLVNALVWGAALVVVKPAFAVTSPFRFLFYRYLIAVVFSLPILIYYWPHFKKLKIKASLPKIAGIELLGTTLALSLLYFGLDRTSAIEASLLVTTTPIFISILGVILLKEREEKHELIGLGLAFIGTFILTGLPLFRGQTSLNGISLTGNLLIFGQNVATAFYFILAKNTTGGCPNYW